MASEVLLVRIDLLRDRKAYVGILRNWLSELSLPGARLATTGALHLLLAAGAPAQLSQLLTFFGERPIDTDAKGQLCVDKFIDVLGRRPVDAAPPIKGFLEMNFLNTAMLEKMLVGEWGADPKWLETALATPRTSAFLAWRAAAKAQRSERRKKSAQEKQQLKQLKQQQQEKEKEQALEAAASEDRAGDEDDRRPAAGDSDVDADADADAGAAAGSQDASDGASDDASAKVAASAHPRGNLGQQAAAPKRRSPASGGQPRRPEGKAKQRQQPQAAASRKRREARPERSHAAKKRAKLPK